jgi:NADPH:quinone reductase-like Zn-dependent oxidoreductase
MDIMQREGKYPLPPQASKTIMGVEFSGVVTKLGKSASKFKEGDEVFGLAYGVGPLFFSYIAQKVELMDREHMPSILSFLREWYSPNQRN